MSRGDENLNKIFQDAFSGQEYQMDPLFWEGMKPMLQTPKVAWYLSKVFLAISTVAILSATLYLVSDSIPGTENQTDLVENNTIVLNPQTNSLATKNGRNTTKNNTDYKTTKSANHELPINNTEPKIRESQNFSNASTTEKIIGSTAIATSETTKITHVNNPISSTFTTNQHIGNNKKEVALKEDYKSTNSVIKNPANSNQHANKNEEFATKTVVSASSITMMGTNTGIASNKNGIKNTASNETTVPNKDVLNHNTSNEINTEKYTSSTINIITQNVNSTPVGLMAINSNFSFPVYKTVSPPPVQNDASLKSLNKPYSIRLSAGYLWSKPLSNPQNSIHNYANSKNIELSLEYHFKPRWGIQIGANFNQVTEDQCRSYPTVEDQSYYDYTDREITINDSTWWLGGWYYYPPTQETVTDTTYISKFDTGQVNLKTSQQIKVIEIPVLLTYNFAVQQFTAQIATGASVGIFANTSGNYLEYGDPVTVKPSSRNLFNSLQYHYLLRTELGYSLNDHWQITASPQMKINLNSLYKNDSGFTNKYLFYGVNAGLTYHF